MTHVLHYPVVPGSSHRDAQRPTQALTLGMSSGSACVNPNPLPETTLDFTPCGGPPGNYKRKLTFQEKLRSVTPCDAPRAMSARVAAARLRTCVV